LLENFDHAAVVPVEILDHRVISCEIEPHLLLEARNVRDVGTQNQALRIEICREALRRDIRIVRRLNAHHGEERFRCAGLAFRRAIFDIADEEVR